MEERKRRGRAASFSVYQPHTASSPPSFPPSLASYPPPFLSTIHIHLHSGLIVSCCGRPLQLAIHLGQAIETELIYGSKGRYMRMPPVAERGGGNTQLGLRYRSCPGSLQALQAPPSLPLFQNKFSPEFKSAPVIRNKESNLWGVSL